MQFKLWWILLILWKSMYQMNSWKGQFANSSGGVLFLTCWKDCAGQEMWIKILQEWTSFLIIFIELSLWNKMPLSLSQTLAGMSEYCSPLLEGCQKNRQHWKCLAEECEKGLVNGLVWFQHQFGFQPTQISGGSPRATWSHKISWN